MRTNILFQILLGAFLAALISGCSARVTTVTSTSTVVTTITTVAATNTIIKKSTLATTVLAPVTEAKVTVTVTIPADTRLPTTAKNSPVPTPALSLPSITQGYKITMDEGVFYPIKLTVPVGAEVEFQSLNHIDTRLHSDYPFFELIPALKSFFFTFNKPGVYKIWEETLPLDMVTITVA